MFVTEDLSRFRARHIQLDWLCEFVFHNRYSDDSPLRRAFFIGWAAMHLGSVGRSLR